MPIIYAPNGMPHYVPNLNVAREWIRKKGYSENDRKLPTSNEDRQQTTPIDITSKSILHINRAGLTELTKITGVGVAKAKKIVAKQPNIIDIEALTDIVDDVDWYEPKIDGKIIVLSFEQ